MRKASAASLVLGLLLGACGAPEPAPATAGSGSEQRTAAREAPAATVPVQHTGARTRLEPVDDSGASAGATSAYLRSVQDFSLPHWAHSLAQRQGLTESLALAYHLNPFYQSGDFDGDGSLDVAVLVERRASGALGILLLHSGTGHTAVLGAGEPFGNGGESFAWLTNWRVRGRGEGGRQGDALEVIKLEAASALIYWTGGGYRWQQLGD